MQVLVVTNNPLVRETCEEMKICYVDGSVENLLLKVRNMVHEGYPLLSHPLPASIRMIYSPYRSVVLGAVSGGGKPDPWHVEVIEDSLMKYRRSTEHRIPDSANDEEYKWMDMQLLTAALKEPRPFG